MIVRMQYGCNVKRYALNYQSKMRKKITRLQYQQKGASAWWYVPVLASFCFISLHVFSTIQKLTAFHHGWFLKWYLLVFSKPNMQWFVTWLSQPLNKFEDDEIAEMSCFCIIRCLTWITFVHVQLTSDTKRDNMNGTEKFRALPDLHSERLLEPNLNPHHCIYIVLAGFLWCSWISHRHRRQPTPLSLTEILVSWCQVSWVARMEIDTSTCVCSSVVVIGSSIIISYCRMYTVYTVCIVILSYSYLLCLFCIL